MERNLLQIIEYSESKCNMVKVLCLKVNSASMCALNNEIVPET